MRNIRNIIQMLPCIFDLSVILWLSFFRGIQEYITNASVSNDGPAYIRCLPYSSISDSCIVWQYASSTFHRRFSSGKIRKLSIYPESLYIQEIFFYEFLITFCFAFFSLTIFSLIVQCLHFLRHMHYHLLYVC